MREQSGVGELFESPAADVAGDTYSLERPLPFTITTIASPSWQSALSRIVEAEIIPRLMLASRAQPQSAISLPAVGPDLSLFIKLLLEADMSAALAYVRQLEIQGLALETIFLDVLGCAARHLGALWESDQCDFVEVTEGLHRLRHILHALTPANDYLAKGQRQIVGRVLFSTAPGETHDFGIMLVEKFFRVAGWQTHICCEADCVAALMKDHYDIVGLSLSCDRYFDAFKAAVKTARQVSKNVNIHVLVGGPAFLRNPDLIHTVDADALATDAREAVCLAESLLKERAYV